VPAQNGVGRHNRRHLREHSTSETHAEHSQSTSFVVGEPHSSALQLRLEDSVLCSEVFDRLVLLASQPGQKDRKSVAREIPDEFTLSDRRPYFQTVRELWDTTRCGLATCR